MKKIDKLMFGSFLGPFAASFGIALFVLVMQFLWLYIDEIAGKGVNLLIMVELIAYLSISLFPLALPVAVMLASVMVMGNLAERYELSSMKSAGISLLRVMVPLMVVCAGIGLFSYVCSDFLIPISNLKFKTRMFDIKRQKPALSIEKGVFNEDFRQFVIRVGDKERDGETIGDVLVIDQSSVNRFKMNEILADSGQMYTTNDKRFFVMNLFNGVQYQEPGLNSSSKKQGYPFVRIGFGSMTKVWDMREFEMNRTDEDNFKSNRQMLSMNQLRAASDSIKLLVEDQHKAIVRDVLLELEKKPAEPPKAARLDSLAIVKRAASLGISGEQSNARPLFHQDSVLQDIGSYTSLLQTFPEKDRSRLLEEAHKKLGVHMSNLETRTKQIESRMIDGVKITYDLYIKYSFAIICLLFLFIGAPMGAIIRKGGFGYPILVAIVFFVVFVMLTIMCRKLAEGFFLAPFWAAMTPWLAMLPVGVVLTWKAMNDSRMLNFEWITRLVHQLRLKRRTVVPSPA
ncbi:MAG: LptF/LptG family permease [Saprospiraceae bacterium]